MPRYCIMLHDLETSAPLGWVRWYDPDASDGGDALWPTGSVTTTWAYEHILSFENREAALVFARQQSKVRPIRPDGRPNRPLTAFTMMIEPLPVQGER